MQLIILGMHRSGTSVLARLLNMMGAYFGPEGISTGANKENPKGFWERKDVRQLNDYVLHSVGCDWDKIASFNINELPQNVKDEFREKASQILLDMDTHRPWLLKEPRLCLLFDLWRELLEVPVCIHIYRNPVEVAHSLYTRNGIAINTGIALWEQYNLLALEGTYGEPRFVVSHNKLMRDPVSEVKYIYEQLQVCGVGNLRMPSEREITSFIRSDLYHEKVDEKEICEYLNTNQSKIFNEFKSGRILKRKNNFKSSKAGILNLEGYEKLEQQEKTFAQQLTQKEQALKKAQVTASKTATDLVQKLGQQEKTFAQQLTQKEQALKEAQATASKTATDLEQKLEQQEKTFAQQLTQKEQALKEAQATASKTETDLEQKLEQQEKTFAQQLTQKEQALKEAQATASKTAAYLEKKLEQQKYFYEDKLEKQAREEKNAVIEAGKVEAELRQKLAQKEQLINELRASASKTEDDLKRQLVEQRRYYTQKIEVLTQEAKTSAVRASKVEHDLNKKLEQQKFQINLVKKGVVGVEKYISRQDEMIRQLFSGIDSLVASRRWLFGNAVFSLRHKLLFRKHPEMETDYLKRVRDRYHDFKAKEQPLHLHVINVLNDNLITESDLHRKLPRETSAPVEVKSISKSAAVLKAPSLHGNKIKISIIAWDVAHNPLGRAYILAESLSSEFDVEIIGPAHSRYGHEVWEPLRETKVPIKYFEGNSSNLCDYYHVLKDVAKQIDGDILYVCKTRMPSLLLGILAKIRLNRPVILDIDDYELSFFKKRTVASLHDIVDLFETKEASCLHDELWTRYAESLYDKVDSVTVSNTELEKKFGGTVIPHIRSETTFRKDNNDERNIIRSHFNYTESDKVILFIGTPRWHKGIGDIIGALEKLNNENYRLCIVGTVSDDKLNAYIKTHKSDNIQIINNTSFFSLPKYLQIGDLVCILQDPKSEISNYQMPAKFTDALAMGIPVLAYDVPPLRPLFQQGLLEFVTRDTLADKISDVFTNIDDYKVKAESNRNIFDVEYSYKSGLARMQGIISSLLTKKIDVHPELLRLKNIFDERCAIKKSGKDTVLIKTLSPVDKQEKIDLVVFWKQNDTGIYGRRQDMLIKYLARKEQIGKIIHFDAPISEAQLQMLVAEYEKDKKSQSGYVYEQTISRLHGRSDGEKISYYTFTYTGGFQINDYISYIQSALKEVGISAGKAVFLTYPKDFNFKVIAEYFKPAFIVADVVDDHRTWPCKKSYKKTLTNNYREILELSDFALANCESVKKSMLEYIDNIHLLPNAFELFGDEIKGWERPAELSEINGRIIGYVGNLDDARIDLKLIEEIACHNRSWQLVFIGSTHRCKGLERLSCEIPNIHLLGVRPYSEALKFIKYFDVAIIPHLDNELTRNMNPLKAYVYVSMSVPIVSTKINNINELGQWLTMVSSSDDMIATIESFLEQERDVSDASNLSEALYKYTWDHRADVILKLLSEHSGRVKSDMPSMLLSA